MLSDHASRLVVTASESAAADLRARFCADRRAIEYFGMCRRRFDLVIDEITARAPTSASVLEVGPAFGHVLLALKRIGYSVQATECPDTIAGGQCRALVEAGVHVAAWDLHLDQRNPLEPNGFDVVICSEVLEHLLMGLEGAVGKISAMLRPGGVLVVTTPNIYRFTNLRRVVAGENICDPFPNEAAVRSGVVMDGRHHPREPAMRELRAALENCGLCVTKSDYFNSVRRPKRSELAFRVLPRWLRDHLLVVGEKTR